MMCIHLLRIMQIDPEQLWHDVLLYICFVSAAVSMLTWIASWWQVQRQSEQEAAAVAHRAVQAIMTRVVQAGTARVSSWSNFCAMTLSM